MIVLFPSNATSFSSNGIGTLSDAIRAFVTEERNGLFELEMEYPINGKHYSQLSSRKIIFAKPNPHSDPQPFVIYGITKPISGVVKINAEHISYALSGYPVSPFHSTDVRDAFDKLKSFSVVPCRFNLITQKTETRGMTISKPTSMRSILGTRILEEYGGEYEFDTFNVYLHDTRGANRGVSIRYGKNLIDLKQEENCRAVYTGVYPFYYTQDNQLIELPEKVVNAPGTYDFTRIYSLDLSSEWDEPPTEQQLRDKAIWYMDDTKIGIPRISINVSFISLYQSDEYNQFTQLETVRLCDTVNIEFQELGVSATSKCIKTVYNVLTDKYESIELGEANSNLASTISAQGRRIEETPTKTIMDEAIDMATKLITGGLGGHVLMHSSTGGSYPDEILIMDTDDVNTAVNVWRWNMGGFGHSSTGINGPYGTAITIKGEIVADFIKTGQLDASVINGSEIDISNNSSIIDKVDIEYVDSQFRVRDDEIASRITKEEFENLQIGARNYFVYNRHDIQVSPDMSTFDGNHPECPYGFYLVGDQDHVNWLRIPNVINSNGYWTISWDMKSNQDVALSVYVDMCDLGQTGFWTTSDNTWKRFSLTVNVTNHGDGSIYNFVDFENFGWAYYFIKNIKIEKGNKPTDWSPSPEDVQNQIDNVTTRMSTAESTITQHSNEILSKVTQTEIDNSINAIKVGGTNLWKDTEKILTSNTTWQGFSGINDGTYKNFTVRKILAQWGRFMQVVQCEPNTEYTLSAWVRRGEEETQQTILGKYCVVSKDKYGLFNNVDTINCPIQIQTGVLNDRVLPTDWVKTSFTIKTPNDPLYSWLGMRFEPYSTPYEGYNVDMRICGLKLEKGNKPTDWSPAPEDTQSQICGVTFKDTTNVTTDSNNIIATGGADNDWNHGCFSNESVGNGQYVEFTIGDMPPSGGGYFMAGLNHLNEGAYYPDIDFAVYYESGNYSIYENGVFVGVKSALQKSDVVRVSVENNKVIYYKNGDWVYTSQVSPTLPLYFDCSMYRLGQSIKNVRIGNSTNVIERIRTAESTITQHSDEIALRVTRTEFEQQVIGGTQILLNTHNFKDTSHWDVTDYNIPSGVTKMASVRNDNWTGYEPALEVALFGSGFDAPQTYAQYGLLQQAKLVVGKRYTLSAEIAGHRSYKRVVVGDSQGWMTQMEYPQNDDTIYGTNDFNNKWTKVKIAFTAREVDSFFSFVINKLYGTDGYLWLRHIKLEEGDKATSWSPSPAEIDSKFSSIELAITPDAIVQKIQQTDGVGKVKTTSGKMDNNGFEVSSSDADTKTQMLPSGFKIVKMSDISQEIASFLASGASMPVASIGTLITTSAPLIMGASVNLYVDPVNGDDNSSGLIDRPCKTIQGAISKVNKALFNNVSVVINVLAGTHVGIGSKIQVNDFFGSGSLKISCPTTGCIIKQGFEIHGNDAAIALMGGRTNYNSADGTRIETLTDAFNISNSKFVDLSKFVVKGTGKTANSGVTCNNGTNIWVYHMDISSFNQAIAGYFFSNIIVYDSCGSDLAYSLISDYGASILVPSSAWIPKADTREHKSMSGTIVYEGTYAETISQANAPAVAPKTSEYYPAISSGSYRDNFAQWRPDNNYLYQGKYDVYGPYTGAFWIDNATFRSKTNTKTFTKAQLYLKRASAGGSNLATTAYLVGIYNSGESGAVDRRTSYGAIGSWAWGEEKWVDINPQALYDLRQGTINALAIFHDSSPYMYFEGYDGAKPQIYVEY